MTTYTKQSRKQKPQPVNQVIERFEKSMHELGYAVDVNYGNGRYSPAINLQAWPKRETKEVRK